MAEKSRLGGRGRQIVTQISHLTTLHKFQLPDMHTALRLSQRQVWKSKSDKDRLREAVIGTRPVDGNAERLKAAIEASESLMQAAIELDPRLARRAQWRRAEEGEHCDAGLLSMGDDQPFYKHTRSVVNDATMAGEPIKVVISTDDSKVPEGTAAAFIATARLVQQFMPLEIWWQGAWLTQDKCRGFVFLVPLVQGDMDFSRLEFCIADQLRDAFSFRVMVSHAALDIKQTWNGCGYRAEYPYLDGARVRFVRHTGIKPDADSIADEAARWLDWEQTFVVQWQLEQNAKSAGQSLPEPPAKYTPMTAEQRRYMEESEQRAEKIAADEAASRINSLIAADE